METPVTKSVQELLGNVTSPASAEWRLQAVIHGECTAYLASNTQAREALWIDPKREALRECLALSEKLSGYLWLAVIDTHTHADHISAAAELAQGLHAPCVMHESAPSRRVHLRISGESSLASRSSPIRLIPAPGHTPDGVCVIWGPFLFTGDTIVYNDVGRDDLPGGDPAAHHASLRKIVSIATPGLVFLPGHDSKGGRADLWENQLRTNSSLTQPREDFVRESSAFVAPAPKQFKESLVENFK